MLSCGSLGMSFLSVCEAEPVGDLQRLSMMLGGSGQDVHCGPVKHRID